MQAARAFSELIRRRPYASTTGAALARGAIGDSLARRRADVERIKIATSDRASTNAREKNARALRGAAAAVR